MGEIARGTVIDGKYRVTGVLGEGGQGVVIEAEHVDLGHRVAIKVLASYLTHDPVGEGRFEREARIVAKLTSPWIVRVHDVGRLPSGSRYLVMDRLEGRSLAAIEAPETHQLLEWSLQICAALAEAHAAGVVHRDLKPSNVFITRSTPRAPSSVRVLDFGIAKEPEGVKLTVTGTTMGTARYMAPEQIDDAHGVDGRADVYSLGVILYKTLGGRFPYDAERLDDLALEQVSRPPTSLDVLRPDLDPALAATIMRAIALSPADRPTIGAFAESLRPFVSAPGPARAHARFTVWAISALLTLVIGGTLLALALPNRSTSVTVSDASPAPVEPSVTTRAESEPVADAAVPDGAVHAAAPTLFFRRGDCGVGAARCARIQQRMVALVRPCAGLLLACGSRVSVDLMVDERGVGSVTSIFDGASCPGDRQLSCVKAKLAGALYPPASTADEPPMWDQTPNKVGMIISAVREKGMER